MQEAANGAHGLDAQVGSGFSERDVVGAVDGQVYRREQFESLAGGPAGEGGLGSANTAGVEPHDVEALVQCIRGASDVGDKLHAAAAGASGIYQQVADPLIGISSPAHVDGDLDGAGIRRPIVGGYVHEAALEAEAAGPLDLLTQGGRFRLLARRRWGAGGRRRC